VAADETLMTPVPEASPWRQCMSPTKRRKQPTPIKPAKASGTREEVVEDSANYALNLLTEAAKHLVWLNVPWAGVLTAMAHADDEVCAGHDSLVDNGLEGKARFDNLVKGCGQCAADTIVKAGLYCEMAFTTRRKIHFACSKRR
jgi:hypothetical protein